MLAKSNYFKALEWVSYIGLWVLSIFVVKEVWDQWLTKETGIKQYEIPTRESPTITICFKNRTESLFALEIGFAILVESSDGWTELQIGVNDISGKDVSMMVLTTWYAHICVKITQPESEENRMLSGALQIWYNETMTQGRNLEFEVTFTSEINSYGIIWNDWIYGKHFTVDLPYGKTKYISLKAVKEIALKSGSDDTCIENSHYDCFVTLINSGDCPKNCVPFQQDLPFMNKIDIPTCDWYSQVDSETSQCYQTLIQEWSWLYCNKSCTTLQYEGVIGYEGEGDMQIQYGIKPGIEKVYEEYLLYNFIGMIGSIGGTMGLFVGLSFFNVALFLIELIQKSIGPQNEIDVPQNHNELTPFQLDQVRNEIRKMNVAKQQLVTSDFAKVDGDF